MEQDQAFLDALQKVRDKKIEHLIPQIDLLLENKITSLKSLYKLVDNPLADVDLRASACTILGSLCKAHYEHEKSIIDKRRALPIVLRALVSPHDEVRKSALGALTRLDSKRGNKIIADIAFDRTDPRDLRNSALWQIGHVGNDTHIEPLLAILQDRSEQAWARKMALQSTAIIASSRKSTRGNDVSQIFYDIIRDETDSVSLRGDAIEQLASLPNTAYLPFFIQLLRHEEPEIRFWASYSIVCNADEYGLVVVPEIDRAIRHDVATPDGWWAIGREVLPAMEDIIFRNVVPDTEWTIHQVLISPEPEYGRYLKSSWQVKGTERTWKPLPQTSTLKIDPAWLADQIKAQWDNAIFNNREPAPQSHLLTWQITVDGNVLIGGLLFDGYAITLTSKPHNDLINTFAAWYRTIIPSEHPLDRYDWAGEGETL